MLKINCVQLKKDGNKKIYIFKIIKNVILIKLEGFVILYRVPQNFQ